jgi:hypothetical protein
MSVRSRSSPWFKQPKPEHPDEQPEDDQNAGADMRNDFEKVIGKDAADEIFEHQSDYLVTEKLRSTLLRVWTTRPPNTYLENFQESVLQRLDGHCHFCGVLIHSSLQPATFQYSKLEELLTVICPICGYAATFNYVEHVSPRFNEMLKELRAAKKEKG